MQRFRRIFKQTLAVLLSVLMVTLVVTSASAVTATPSGRNTASRSTDATVLSSQAITYYTSEVSQYTGADAYQTFVSLAGENPANGNGTSYKATQNNALYTTLYNIMSSTQSAIPTYSGTGNNSLAHYWLTTDTSDKDTGDNSYTFFYSDVPCENHTKMQREHIWPKSQASFHEHNGGADLHHLRPAYATVNTVKSNWGFGDIKLNATRTVEWPEGTVSLWKSTVDGDTYIDVKDDVRGDVARILLYVYTRWQQPNLYSDVDKVDLPALESDKSNKDDGRKIVQSLDVLLDWMKNDPVSEWEMERNDLTENIQGNRNVFIDYPELAWLLFDREVPDITTPSNEAHSQTPGGFSDPVTLAFSVEHTGNYQGVANISAVDNNDKPLMNGSVVERGTPITYTITPNASTLSSITFNGSKSAISTNKMFTSYDLTNGSYKFTKKAGFSWDYTNHCEVETTSSLSTEPIYVFLSSQASELYFNIRSASATGTKNTGSGSGMVTARIADTSTIIHSGDTIPNGTDVTLTFTPDYGSRFSEVTSNNFSGLNNQVTKNVNGSDSAQVTINNINSASTTRAKTINVYFAQTFNKTGANSSKHIDNSGMWPDEADQWGEAMGFTQNFEICGVQLKQSKDTNNKALRFVSVIDKELLSKAKEYGYVISYTNYNTLGSEFINSNAYTLTRNGAHGVTLDCTNTDNDYFGDYGKHDTDKNYKYITAAVNNIQDGGEIGENTTIIARPYVVLKDDYIGTNAPSVVYGQYMDINTGEAYCACSGSYNYISSLMS